MAARTEWLVTANGKEWGPFSSSQLKQLAQQGRVIPEMLLRRTSDERPYPAGRVDGLFSASQAAQSSSHPGNGGSQNKSTKSQTDGGIDLTNRAAPGSPPPPPQEALGRSASAQVSLPNERDSAPAVNAWHYRFMGEEFGPLSMAELKQQAAARRIAPDSLVRRVGTLDYFTADSLGLFGTSIAEEPVAVARTIKRAARRSVDQVAAESLGLASIASPSAQSEAAFPAHTLQVPPVPMQEQTECDPSFPTRSTRGRSFGSTTTTAITGVATLVGAYFLWQWITVPSFAEVREKFESRLRSRGEWEDFIWENHGPDYIVMASHRLRIKATCAEFRKMDGLMLTHYFRIKIGKHAGYLQVSPNKEDLHDVLPDSLGFQDYVVNSDGSLWTGDVEFGTPESNRILMYREKAEEFASAMFYAVNRNLKERAW